MTELQKEIVLKLCDCNMKITAVAREMHYYHESIRQHVRKIKEKTGLDPRCFYDLIKLRKMILAERGILDEN